ncbi:MAG: hypothetical protein ACTSPY_09545 [Candidatus Helarchaeota archaeon]
MPDLFEDIKKVVYQELGRRRAGLSLGLADIGVYNGFYIGAYHILSSNYIILNKTPLILLKNKPEEMIIAYLYHLLLHEYIHTLGVIDEKLCRQITYELSKKTFGTDHIITVLARGGLNKLFPEIIYAPVNFGLKTNYQIEIVYGFDKSNITYYS